MSDWFFPLMLVAVLAVYVLLSLQGRRDAARVVDALRGRLEALEAALRESVAGAPSDGSEAAGPAPDPAGGILDALQRSLTDQGVAVERLSQALERVEARLDATPTAAGGPKDIARAFLVTEGYSSIRVLEQSDVPEGVRVQVGGLRGDEVRHGHVVVANGRVVDATLEVPTTLFP